MSFRTRLAVLALVASLPAIAGRIAQADPAAQLDAAVEKRAAASSERAVAASIAREDAAIQSAIDRKLDARIATALGPVRARTSEMAARSRRVLYAVR